MPKSELTICATTPTGSTPAAATSVGSKRGLSFWMVIISNLIIDLLSVLDLVRPHASARARYFSYPPTCARIHT